MSTTRSYSLAFLSSFLLFSAAPGQWSCPAAVWLALVPLLLACRNRSWRSAAGLAFLSGWLYHLSLIYWIIVALNNYGGLPLWLAIPAMALLATYMAVYFAIFGALLIWLKRYPITWSAPIAWVALDFIRGHLFTGFPWQDLGYSQYQHPLLIQFADLTGHSGLTFLIVMANALLADLILSRWRATGPRLHLRKIVLPLLILTGAGLYNFWSYNHWQHITDQAPVLNIGLVQGNIDQGKKWQPGLQGTTVDTYLDLSRKMEASSKIKLLIWPETALPFFPLRSPLFNQVLQEIRPGSPELITGAPHYEPPTDKQSGRYYNSAFCLAWNADGIKMQRYDKEHLVPFGEYIPFQKYLPGSLPLVKSMGNFSAGTSKKPMHCGKARCGILICFESIFPDLARKWSASGANLLLNLTNDAWYGRTSAPWQQLSMVTLRAVENRRSLARAANTGISCFVDPLGRLRGVSPLFEPYTASARMPLLQAASFYTRYGYLFSPLCLLILSLMLLYGIYNKLGRQVK